MYLSKICKQPITNLFNSEKLESSNGLCYRKNIKFEWPNIIKNSNFLSLQPTNLAVWNDNFNIKSGHVIPALINKFHEGKIKNKKYVEVWGSGKVKREFLFVDDLADAIEFLLRKKTKHNVINVGSGEEITIKNLSKLIASITGYKGKIIFNKNYPDGTPRKIVDNSILSKWDGNIKLN